MLRRLLSGLLVLASAGCTLIYDTDDLGSSSESDGLAVLQAEPALVPRGSGGLRTVTITGAGFLRGAELTFDDEPVDYQYVSASALVAQVPNDIGYGAVEITVTQASDSDTLSGGFYIYADPVRLAEPTAIAITENVTWDGWNNGQLNDLVYRDVNRDGAFDIVLLVNGNVGEPGHVIELRGDGTGGFAFDPAAGYIALGSDNRALVYADIDGDGIEDSAVSRVSTASAGDARLSIAGAIAFPAVADGSAGGIGLVALDDDGDGVARLALLRSTDADTEVLEILELNQARDGFESVASYSDPGNDVAQTAFGNEVFSFSSSFGAGAEKGNLLVAGDFNSDGATDLVAPVCKAAGTEITAVGIFTSVEQALGAPTVQPITGASPGGFASLTAVDINRDGNLDLVAGARNGNQVWTLLGNGAGGFDAASSTVGMSPSELVLTDFNADGVDDIWVCDREPATAGQVQRTELHLGLPEGGFDAAAELSFEIPVDANFQVWCGGLLAEDVDDDGLPDLILGTSVQATDGGPVELDMNIYINESDG